MASNTAPSTAVTPDSLITIKVAIDGTNRRFKLPLRDLTASVFPDKLRSLLLPHLAPLHHRLLLERFSDSSSAYIALDPSNPSTYKQLYRAAKAKLKLRIKATVLTDLPDDAKAAHVDDPPIQPDEAFEPTKQPGPVEPANSEPAATQAAESVEAASSKQSSPNGRNHFCDQLAAMSRERELGRRLKEAPFQPAIGFQVSCDNCHKSIADAHFHCSICEAGDYDLCEACVQAGKVCPGDGHWMIKRFIKNGKVVTTNTERQVRKLRPTTVEKEPQIPGAFEAENKAESLENDAIRTCNACVRVLPKKLLVTCNDCDDFDLCMPCHIAGKSGHHPGHLFKPIVDDAAVSKQVHDLCPPGRNVRHHALCDGCDKTIHGVRHKCLDCPDWDFCNSCVSNAPKVHSDHRFVPIYEPISVPKRISDMASNYHFAVYCDGPLCKGKANQQYIRGIRYKCAICHDTDFCAVCEAHPSNKHNTTHPLIKLKAQVRNVTVSTTGEDAHGTVLPVMGDQNLSRVPSAAPPTTANETTNVSNETLPPYTREEKVNATSQSNVAAPNSRMELDAHFIRDLVKDGTQYGPDVQFRQVWTMRNPGPHPWPVGCSVRRVGGDNMLDIRRSHAASLSELAVATETNATTCVIPPGQEFGFMVSMRTPANEGKYISYWRLKAPDGTAFGHKLWCDVEVKLNGPENYTLPPGPPPYQGRMISAPLGGFRGPPPSPATRPNFNEATRTVAQGQATSAVKPNSSALEDYEMQLKMLEQQNRQRRSESGPSPVKPKAGAVEDFQMQLMLLEQQNKKRLELVRAQARDLQNFRRQANVQPYPSPNVAPPPPPKFWPGLNQDAEQKFADIKSQLTAIEEANDRHLSRWREGWRAQQGLAGPSVSRPHDLAQRFRTHPMPAHHDIDATRSLSSDNTQAPVEPLRPDYIQYSMNTKDRNTATAAAAAAAAAAMSNLKEEAEATASAQTKSPEQKEQSDDQELHNSPMVFPKLEKESPTSSTQLNAAPVDSAPPSAAVSTVAASHNETVTETETVTSAGEEEQFETLSAADVEFYEASEEGSDDEEEDGEAFLTDEEYDILDASDEELMNRGTSGL